MRCHRKYYDFEKLYFWETTFYKSYCSRICFPLTKNSSSFIFVVHYSMIRMIEAGLIAKFHSKWWPRVSECSQDSSKSATALQIDSMAGIFIVYAAFSGLALIFFVSEMVFYFFIRRQRDTKIKSSEVTNLKQPLWWYKF